MLGKGFDQIASLHPVQQHMAAIIRAIQQFARPIKVESPGISAPFAKQFKLSRQWMIAPNPLLKFDPANVGGHGTSLTTIQPSVRTPRQRVRNAVRVFHSKSRQ